MREFKIYGEIGDNHYILFFKESFLNGSFLLQFLGNKNRTTTVPGISFSSCLRLIFFATLKFIERKKINKEN